MLIDNDEIEKLFTYHKPTDESVDKLFKIREAAKDFAKLVNETLPTSADKSAAIRKLRECVMTINACIVLNQGLE